MKRMTTVIMTLAMLLAAACGGKDGASTEDGRQQTSGTAQGGNDGKTGNDDDDDNGTPVDDGTRCVDAPLVLELDSAPEFGTSGSIKVFTSDGTLADEIDMADIATVTIREDGQMIPKEQIAATTTCNTFHNPLKCGTAYRTVHYTPLYRDGNTLSIWLHCGALDFDTEYYVTMDAGVLKDHPGIAEGEWTFKTKAKPSSKTEITVSPDGKSDFCTIQRAIMHSYDAGRTSETTIRVGAGVYREMLFARDRSNLTIRGVNSDEAVIRYANNESYEGGSGGSAGTKPSVGSSINKSGGRGLALFENCDNLVLQGLTIENSFGELKGQAECIYFNSGNNTHKLTIEGCTLLSLQDTFLCKGNVWVHNSLIAGHCDFIWGYPSACLFEECEIRAEDAGYIVQARVPNATDKGFVFLDCRLTGASGVGKGKMYLARSGGSADYYDNVTFINCTMEDVIAQAGWYSNPAPNPSSPTASSGWKEYGSKDASGEAVTGHNSYGKVLTAAEAEPFSSRKSVLGR